MSATIPQGKVTSGATMAHSPVFCCPPEDIWNGRKDKMHSCFARNKKGLQLQLILCSISQQQFSTCNKQLLHCRSIMFVDISMITLHRANDAVLPVITEFYH